MDTGIALGTVLELSFATAITLWNDTESEIGRVGIPRVASDEVSDAFLWRS